MFNKKVVNGLCTLIGISLVCPLFQAYGQENISPIESVEWINGNREDEQSTTEEEIEISEESEMTEESESSTEDITDEETSDQAEPEEIDTSSPVAFVESLRNSDRKAFEYVAFANEGELLSIISHNMYKDGNRYFSAQLFPPFLPYTQYTESDRETVQSTYISVDDLILYAADALNQQPQIYEGSVVQDFYTFSQEHHEELSGKLIEVDPETARLTEITLELYQIEDFLTEVLIDWLSNQLVLDQFMETELGQQVDITGEVGDLFREIALAKAEDYPKVATFIEQYQNGFEGTVMFNYDKKLLGLGLISEISETQATGSEIYLELGQEKIPKFTPEQIISNQDFIELVGSDVLTEIQEFEATLTPDMFVPIEETSSEETEMLENAEVIESTEGAE